MLYKQNHQRRYYSRVLSACRLKSNFMDMAYEKTTRFFVQTSSFHLTPSILPAYLYPADSSDLYSTERICCWFDRSLPEAHWQCPHDDSDHLNVTDDNWPASLFEASRQNDTSRTAFHDQDECSYPTPGFLDVTFQSRFGAYVWPLPGVWHRWYEQSHHAAHFLLPITQLVTQLKRAHLLICSVT